MNDHAQAASAAGTPEPFTVNGFLLEDGDEHLLERARLAASLLSRIDTVASYRMAVQPEELAAVAAGIEDCLRQVQQGGHWMNDIPVPGARVGGAA